MSLASSARHAPRRIQASGQRGDHRDRECIHELLPREVEFDQPAERPAIDHSDEQHRRQHTRRNRREERDEPHESRPALDERSPRLAA